METVYRKLIEAWNRELSSPDLQPLNDNFYGNVRGYLDDLKKFLEQEGLSSIEGSLRRKEFERIKFLLNDLIRKRALKVFKSLILGEITFEISKLTIEERDAIKYFKELERSLVEIAGNYSKSVPSTLKSVKVGKDKRKGELLVRFLKPIPKIVGVNLKNYGPFEVEDLASLPIENVNPLISKGTVVRVNWDNKSKRLKEKND